jgi:hypothetical protein
MWRKPKDIGIVVPVQLDRLIESVFVALGAPNWFYKVVDSVSAKYGLSAEVYEGDPPEGKGSEVVGQLGGGF